MVNRRLNFVQALNGQTDGRTDRQDAVRIAVSKSQKTYHETLQNYTFLRHLYKNVSTKNREIGNVHAKARNF